MKYWFALGVTFALCFLPFIAPGADRENEGSSGPTTEAQKKYAALVKGYEEARNEYFKAYQKAKTDQDREKLSYPDPQSYAQRFLDLAKAYPADSAAVEALVWIGQNCRGGEPFDQS